MSTFSELSSLAPNVAIVGLFVWYLYIKDKQTEEREKRFLTSAEKKDQHHAEALDKFTSVMNKVGEYIPKMTEALNTYNDYFPKLYKHNEELVKKIKDKRKVKN